MTINITGLSTEFLDVPTLMHVTSNIKPKSNWFGQYFFKNKMMFDGKGVPIGSLTLSEPIAPYVSSCVEGQPLATTQSGSVTFIDAPYLKPKTALTPCNNSTQEMMKIFTGGKPRRLSDHEKFVMAQIKAAVDHETAIDNRITMMQSELITTGKIIVESDAHPHYVIDYGRDAACNYAPAIPWDNPASKPLDDINAMANILFNKSKAPATVALMRNSVWQALSSHKDFVEQYAFIKTGETNPLSWLEKQGYGALEMFRYKNITFVVLEDSLTLVNPTDKNLPPIEKFLLPDGYFALTSDQTKGVVAYCTIEDLESGQVPMEYFHKTWLNKDPSAFFHLTQSAPLPVPGRINGVVGGAGFVS